LDLAESLGATEEAYGADNANGWEKLAQGPALVVHEEGTFHSQDRAEERGVREGRRAKGRWEVSKIGADSDPLE